MDMDEVFDEFERLRRTCTSAPGREGDGHPGWQKTGIESLPEFFNTTAHLWDARFGPSYSDLHQATAQQIPATDEPIRILDVGCGTGLEFGHILARAPNARITGLDQAPRMLQEIERKFANRMDQITLIEASCLEWPDGLRDFDHVVSILTVHHFPPATKVGIYAAIRSALGIDGSYVEGDQSGTPEHDTDTMATFSGWIAKLPDGERGAWNYDVTLSVGANQSLLREAGFTSFEVPWEVRDETGMGHAVMVSR